MKFLKAIALIAIISLSACTKTENSAAPDSNTDQPKNKDITTENPYEADKQEIEKLVKSMYVHHEQAHDRHSFKPVIKDTLIVGYDMTEHKLYLEKLRKTGFFTEEFITNMDNIVKKQDELLRTRKIELPEGDMPPFNGNVDSWCNCPDNDDYNKISLHFEQINPKTAKFYWNWEGLGDPSWAAHHYNMRTVKENGKWKIAWMEGWDYETSTRY